MQNCRFISKAMPLLLFHDIQQVSFVFRIPLRASTIISSMRLHEIEYYLVLLILMPVLEMLKVFYIKSDEEKLLSTTVTAFNPKTWIASFAVLPPGNHIFQLFFNFFALSLGRLLTFWCPSVAHQCGWAQYCQETHGNTHVHMKES